MNVHAAASAFLASLAMLGCDTPNEMLPSRSALQSATGNENSVVDRNAMDRRGALIEKIKQQGTIGYGRPGPVVLLEDFFTGNDDVGSIGANLLEHPGIDTFFSVLRGIRERADVQHVLVEIYEFDESDESVWPYSERVYVITSARADDVASWLAKLQPDEVSEGWFTGRPDAAPEPQAGYRVFGVWWD